MDVYDRVQRDDMVQQATVIAVFAYNAAMRDEKLPRKPLPKPQPQRGTSSAGVVVLSPSTYPTKAPGAVKNDATILLQPR